MEKDSSPTCNNTENGINYEKLPAMVRMILQTLMDEIALLGPVRGDWPNYSKLDGNRHHCHLKKGKPTYVAVWIAEKKTVTVEIVYVGTHEKVPY